MRVRDHEFARAYVPMSSCVCVSITTSSTTLLMTIPIKKYNSSVSRYCDKNESSMPCMTSPLYPPNPFLLLPAEREVAVERPPIVLSDPDENVPPEFTGKGRLKVHCG